MNMWEKLFGKKRRESDRAVLRECELEIERQEANEDRARREALAAIAKAFGRPLA